MKSAITALALATMLAAFVHQAEAKSSHSDSAKSSRSSRSDSDRPRIGHHSGMNGPSEKGWGGGGGYHK
jgi:hypothetical protein